MKYIVFFNTSTNSSGRTVRFISYQIKRKPLYLVHLELWQVLLMAGEQFVSHLADLSQ